jgi:hypothetical protein
MTVYVVQNALHKDHATGELVPKFDYGPAEEFGEIRFLLNDQARPFILAPIIDELNDKLSSFGPQDYLLLTGNPTFLGLAFSIAANYNDGNLRVLQWHGRSGTYTPIEVRDVFRDQRDEDPDCGEE